MVIASLVALALAAADGPISTAQRTRTETPPPAPAAAAPAGPARDPEIPASAPVDDYGFVAWCNGALTGHMELHDRVKPELDKVSPGQDDAEQTKAGREYLDLYTRALRAAEKASPTAIRDRGVEANAAGYRIWAAARAAEPRTQMWSYLMWELPPRCEIVAKKLEERSSLFAEALRDAPPAPTPTSAATEGKPNDKPSEGGDAPPAPVGEVDGLRGSQ